jgi:nucleoside-diphosphate-sugar epimerase
MNILFTGDRGFIAGYAIPELLGAGYFVVGIDNDSKYGCMRKSYDGCENYVHINDDAKNESLLASIIREYRINQMIANAALIGGISYFHAIPYTLLKENELLTIAAFQAAIKTDIEKINVLSSSMVFENTDKFPSYESDVRFKIAPPLSSYGFQKLATEYYCRSAFDEHKLLYTIIRPFNCIGVGEAKAKLEKKVMSGNIQLAMSHVVPDLIQKVLKGQHPIHILGSGEQIRCYTYAGDIAKAIRMCIQSQNALCTDFNISTNRQTTVKELLEIIWNKIYPGKELKIIHDEPYKFDVQKRIPDVSKAKDLLGFEAKTTLEEALDEVIPWVDNAIKEGII